MCTVSEMIVTRVPHPQHKVGGGMHENKRKVVQPFLATLKYIIL